MKLARIIQESLVVLLCYDDSVAGIAASLVPAKTFDPVFADIAGEAIEYREKYGQVPGEHTLDLINRLKERTPDRAEIYDRIFGSLEETREGINPQYVLDQASVFSRYQKMHRGMSKALKALNRGDNQGVLEAESLLVQAVKQTNKSFDRGTQFGLDMERSLAFLDTGRVAFPTDIPELDFRGLGPARKRLHLYLGTPKSGKSWWLVHLAKAALKRGLRVLYVTLELSEGEVCQRFCQTLFSITKREQDVSYFVFTDGPSGRRLRQAGERPHLQEPGIQKLLINKLNNFIGSRHSLIIKGFPSGTLSVRDLESFLDILAERDAFVPDLLLVDYVNLMRVESSMDLRLALGRLYVDLRGVAQKRDIAVAVPTQASKVGKKARRVDVEHISEDWSGIATADVVLTYSQTEAEYKLGLARLYVAAGRTDEDKFEVVISQAYKMGQFCRSSTMLSNEYFKSLKERDDEGE